MRIDVAQLMRLNGVRRKRVVMRPIVPTQTQVRDLYRVFLPVVTAWEAGIRDRLMPEYERTVSGLRMDSVIDLEAIVRAIEDAVGVLITTEIRAGISMWADREAEWHFQKFVANLKYVTNVDLKMFMGPAGSRVTMEDFLARNTALIRDVSDQIRGRVADIVYRNVQLRTPMRDVAREIANATGMSRRRAMLIARDQTQKISAALDADRGMQIGAPGYDWQHSDKLNYRPEHRERDGKYFAFGSEVDRTDPPGYAVACGCKRRIVLTASE